MLRRASPLQCEMLEGTLDMLILQKLVLGDFAQIDRPLLLDCAKWYCTDGHIHHADDFRGCFGGDP